MGVRSSFLITFLKSSEYCSTKSGTAARIDSSESPFSTMVEIVCNVVRIYRALMLGSYSNGLDAASCIDVAEGKEALAMLSYHERILFI